MIQENGVVLMARVTVEDCVERVTNRFELVLLAGQRSRSISAGGELTVERDNDKNPVVALREIADETIELDELRDSLVKGLQKVTEIDEPEEDEPMEDLLGLDDGGDTQEQPEGEVDEYCSTSGKL